MDVFYTGATALWFWRTVAARSAAPSRVSRTIEPDSYAHTASQELSCRPNWLDPTLILRSGGQVHPLVFHRNRRKTAGEQEWHLCERAPLDAFVPAGESSFVVSPEFCFVQLAQTLDFVDLALVGMELCGTYCLDPDEDEGFGARAEPLTSVSRIDAFLQSNSWIRGKRRAQTVLRYLMDGAASPMESAIALLLTLPYKRGGYCLPQPELNRRIDLDATAKRLAGQSFCRGDLCWPDSCLDLEYLGRSSHDALPNMLKDRGRTLAIEHMGYEVIEITREQALDLFAFDVVARRVASHLGKRLIKEKCGSTPERKYLFSQIYRWGDDNPSIQEELPPEEAGEDKVFGRMA